MTRPMSSAPAIVPPVPAYRSHVCIIVIRLVVIVIQDQQPPLVVKGEKRRLGIEDGAS